MRALLTSLSTLFSLLFDFVAPARPSLRLIRGATLSDVLARQNKDGSLPYHDPLVRALVWETKYYANPHALKLCGHILGERLFDLASEELGTPLLIPIPMHPKRRGERGHNQTELLCEAALQITLSPNIFSKKSSDLPSRAEPLAGQTIFSKTFGFEYEPNVLVKQKQTLQQQGLPEHIRRKNIRNSMFVNNVQKIEGRVCVVLDDVTTTGATFEEATRALYTAGARKVITVALAHS